jgi:hypothetical protein
MIFDSGGIMDLLNFNFHPLALTKAEKRAYVQKSKEKIEQKIKLCLRRR